MFFSAILIDSLSHSLSITYRHKIRREPFYHIHEERRENPVVPIEFAHTLRGASINKLGTTEESKTLCEWILLLPIQNQEFATLLF